MDKAKHLMMQCTEKVRCQFQNLYSQKKQLEKQTTNQTNAKLMFVNNQITQLHQCLSNIDDNFVLLKKQMNNRCIEETRYRIYLIFKI